MSGDSLDHTTPLVAVVVPTHNRWQTARELLRRILASDYPRFLVFVVAHGCDDDTVASCRQEFPQVSVVPGDSSLWWGGAINLGTRQALPAQPDYVLWINDDNWVEPQTLGTLVSSARTLGPKAVIASRIRNGDGCEWVGQPSPLEALVRGPWENPDLEPREIPLQHPPGGQGVLLPRACFEEVGLVDAQRFPHYWGDHDFHLRAMAAGFRYHLSTGAVVLNLPNDRPSTDPFTVCSASRFLLSRRSAMNVWTVRRFLYHSVGAKKPGPLFRRWLRGTVFWLGTGVISRHRVLLLLARRAGHGLSMIRKIVRSEGEMGP